MNDDDCYDDDEDDDRYWWWWLLWWCCYLLSQGLYIYRMIWLMHTYNSQIRILINLSIYHINLSYYTNYIYMSILSVSGTKGSSPGIMILYTTHVMFRIDNWFCLYIYIYILRWCDCWCETVLLIVDEW